MCSNEYKFRLPQSSLTTWDQGILSSSQRNGIITLLPKKDRDPTSVKNYRPISLCLLTTDYKLIAKTMANRLKLVLGGLINDDQNGFIKGRNIGCNIHTIVTELLFIIFIPRGDLTDLKIFPVFGDGQINKIHVNCDYVFSLCFPTHLSIIMLFLPSCGRTVN